MPRKSSENDAVHAYNSWDREAAVARALQHADRSQATDPSSGGIWNFAFGSNMSAKKVASRGMKPWAASRGVLPGWSLMFNHRGGYGNIEAVDQKLDPVKYKPQEEVHGALLLLSREEFARLAWEEYAYDTVEVPVCLHQYPQCTQGLQGRGQRREREREREQSTGDTGTRVGVPSPSSVQHALAFKTAACAVTDAQTLPSTRYIRLLQEGARGSGLAEGYCEWLDGIPSSS
jgi:hypothetical protein